MGTIRLGIRIVSEIICSKKFTMVRRNILCRICLMKSDRTVSLDAHFSEKISISIGRVLEKVMSVPLIINDVYPNKICELCLVHLGIAYDLRIQFENSQSSLLNIYKDKKTENSGVPIEAIATLESTDNLKYLEIVEEPQTADIDFEKFSKCIAEQLNKNRKQNKKLKSRVAKKISSSKCKTELSDFSNDNVEVEGAFVESTSYQENGDVGETFELHSHKEGSKNVVDYIQDHPNVEIIKIVYQSDSDMTSTYEEAEDGKHENGVIVSEKRKKYSRSKLKSTSKHIEDGDDMSFETSPFPDIVKMFREVTDKYKDVDMSGSSKDMNLQKCHNLLASQEQYGIHSSTCKNPSEVYTCEKCKLSFHKKSALSYHNLTKHNERRFICHICGTKFFTKCALDKHVLGHTDRTGTKCICPVCGKTFHYTGGLFYHMKQHTNERKYVCEYCDKNFYTMTSKKRHLLTHTGDRPFNCKSCEKKFFSSGELHKHEYLHKVERPHNCEICGKGFTSRFNMNTHQFVHPGNIICKVCKKGFVSESVMKHHFRMKHKDLKNEKEEDG